MAYERKFLKCNLHEDEDLHEAIIEGVAAGMKKKELLPLLRRSFPQYAWSISTLGRRMKDLGITYHTPVTHDELVETIKKTLSEIGGDSGYRAVQKHIRLVHKKMVTRDRVMVVLRTIQPEKVAERVPKFKEKVPKKPFKANGPNWLYSGDGHDKLCGYQNNAFPLKIYGWLDTYSRKIIDLWIGQSNKNPRIVGKRYLQMLERTRVLPRRLRLDCGTETGDVAAVQMTLLAHKGIVQAKEVSVMLGPSTSNKIERFWKDLHSSLETRYKEFLSNLITSGQYDPQEGTDRDILAGVFIPVIQRSLDAYVREYNLHRIRAQKGVLLPNGIPAHIWACPEEFGAVDCGLPLLDADIQMIWRESGLRDVSTDLDVCRDVAEALSAFTDVPEPDDVVERYLAVRGMFISCISTTSGV